MKLIFVYIVSWLVGLFSSMLVSYFYYDEPLSVADLMGFATLSLVPAFLVCALLYTPCHYPHFYFCPSISWGIGERTTK